MWKINLSKSTFLVLFLAVGFMVGMSFSSVYAGIPWGTSEIADNAITSEKIKNRQVKAPDIKNNAVKTNKIRDGTILFSDINQNGCASNQIMKWNGASWLCAPDLTGGMITVTTISPAPCISNPNVGTSGWCPDFSKTQFNIVEPAATSTSVVAINLIGSTSVCSVNSLSFQVSGIFQVNCVTGPGSGSKLIYTVLK